MGNSKSPFGPVAGWGPCLLQPSRFPGGPLLEEAHSQSAAPRRFSCLLLYLQVDYVHLCKRRLVNTFLPGTSLVTWPVYTAPGCQVFVYLAAAPLAHAQYAPHRLSWAAVSL